MSNHTVMLDKEMILDTRICQQARLSKDIRFDGKFFTAVLTTGIFCRPICTARAPYEENVRYYKNALLAQEAGFRPCKRCLPELAPQTQFPVQVKQLVLALESGESITAISKQFALSDRQIRRIFVKHYGLSPIKYLHQQKLLLASRLIKTTNLPISDIAFAAGFKSIRRFNEVIKTAYHCSPSDLRRSPSHTRSKAPESYVTILLPYRPPFDWPLMLKFFQKRQLNNVERVTESEYSRTITYEKATGWFSVSHAEEPQTKISHKKNKEALLLKVQLSDYRYLNHVISQVRQMFDLDADMPLIHQQLCKHPILAEVIKETPGLRLPGCWDIFEFSIRAILGQQISVKAATTLANRIALKYGEVSHNNPLDISHHFPSPEALRHAEYEEIGLTKSRISTLKNWLDFYLKNSEIFQCYTSLETLEQRLVKIKGIGPWTVNYIAMRGLSNPDAFPSADLGIIKALATDNIRPSNKEILALSKSWRPWRAYAAIYLWQSLAKHAK